MGRRPSDEELEAMDRAHAAVAKAQRECGHYYCRPVEWYWSGAVRVMQCDDCGSQDFREEQ
ncbi:hypothetical protein [Pseudomonas phage LKA1]|uniref:Uncharacterized protein n=1 Tax=Pseudomonas phage LKA1 TaxID=386793 RepID=Q0E5Z3_9CAUD|nr:hypothetical protein AV952_gp21 [Pseudomonas phage LKA1]CAK24989.1 hypothetical protein [Pseudomonas phage LKA1]